MHHYYSLNFLLIIYVFPIFKIYPSTQWDTAALNANHKDNLAKPRKLAIPRATGGIWRIFKLTWLTCAHLCSVLLSFAQLCSVVLSCAQWQRGVRGAEDWEEKATAASVSTKVFCVSAAGCFSRRSRRDNTLQCAVSTCKYVRKPKDMFWVWASYHTLETGVFPFLFYVLLLPLRLQALFSWSSSLCPVQVKVLTRL